MTHNNYIYIAVMALVSYAIRILPLTLIRKPNQEPVRSVVPVLCALCHAGRHDLPGHRAGHPEPVAGAVALVIGIAAAWCGASLFQVAVACCAVVLCWNSSSEKCSCALKLSLWGAVAFLTAQNMLY